MATRTDRAGKSARQMAETRRKTGIIIGIVGILLIAVVGLIMQNANALGIGGTSLVGLFIMLRILPDVIEKVINKKYKESNRAVRGAKGEEAIADILGSLGTNYLVIHDVNSPYGNIDHIVISRQGGVFLVETKAHGGKVTTSGDQIMVNGKVPEKDFIAQTLRNTFWLRDHIAIVTGEKPWVTAMIVFSNAFVTRGKPIKGIQIINKRYLLGTMQRSGRISTSAAQKLWARKLDLEKHLLK